MSFYDSLISSTPLSLCLPSPAFIFAQLASPSFTCLPQSVSQWAGEEINHWSIDSLCNSSHPVKTVFNIDRCFHACIRRFVGRLCRMSVCLCLCKYVNAISNKSSNKEETQISSILFSCGSTCAYSFSLSLFPLYLSITRTASAAHVII